MRSALLLSALFVASAQLQPQSPVPPEAGRNKKENTTRQDSKVGNDKSVPPVVPFVVDTPVVQDAAKHEQEPAPTDWWIRIFTGVIAFAAVAQLYIYWRQKQLMATALAETKKATDAASDGVAVARDSFAASHRPKFVVRFMAAFDTAPLTAVGEGITDVVLNGRDKIQGRFLISNAGGSDATIAKIYSEVIVAERLPASPPYEGRQDIPEHPAIVVKAGQTYSLPFPAIEPRELGALEIQDIGRGSKRLYVIGWVEYIDALKIRRKMGFCRRWDALSQRFLIERDQDYEYDDQG